MGLGSEAVAIYAAEVTPIVMSKILEDDSEGQEETVASVLNYSHKYDGICISDEGYGIINADRGSCCIQSREYRPWRGIHYR